MGHLLVYRPVHQLRSPRFWLTMPIAVALLFVVSQLLKWAWPARSADWGMATVVLLVLAVSAPGWEQWINTVRRPPRV